jgi:hypothetical protein
VRYRSRVIFRIGSYCLPHSRSISKERYSGYLVLTFRGSLTGLSPFLAPLSSGLQVPWLSQTQVQTPHLRFLSERIRFVLFPFQSPLLGESRFLSFPAGTKMFQFSASAIPADHLEEMGSPIEAFRVQRLHAPTPDLLQLATLFIATRAKTSTIQYT